MLTSFAQLREKAGAARPQTVAVACAHDPHTLEAVLKAADEGILRYVLIGHREEILDIGRTLGHEIDEADVIPAETDQEAAEITVALVREGKADFLQKGLMQTATILKAVVNKERGIGLGRPMSHTALLEIPGYHKLLGVTDGGMVRALHMEAIDWESVIAETVPEKFRELNLRAYRAGYDAAE